jgi:hypothetical protein
MAPLRDHGHRTARAADAAGDVDLIGKTARPRTDVAVTLTVIDAARAVTETGAA